MLDGISKTPEFSEYIRFWQSLTGRSPQPFREILEVYCSTSLNQILKCQQLAAGLSRARNLVEDK